MLLKLELATELLIGLNTNRYEALAKVTARALFGGVVVQVRVFHYNCCCYSVTRFYLSTPRGENTVKKLLSMTFALALMASMSFAQSSAGSASTSPSTGSGTVASGQASTDQSTTTTTTKTKKHKKHHKKSTSGDTGTTNPSGATSTTPETPK